MTQLAKTAPALLDAQELERDIAQAVEGERAAIKAALAKQSRFAAALGPQVREWSSDVMSRALRELEVQRACVEAAVRAERFAVFTTLSAGVRAAQAREPMQEHPQYPVNRMWTTVDLREREAARLAKTKAKPKNSRRRLPF